MGKGPVQRARPRAFAGAHAADSAIAGLFLVPQRPAGNADSTRRRTGSTRE
jgi:hypothetical protein